MTMLHLSYSQCAMRRSRMRQRPVVATPQASPAITLHQTGNPAGYLALHLWNNVEPCSTVQPCSFLTSRIIWSCLLPCTWATWQCREVLQWWLPAVWNYRVTLQQCTTKSSRAVPSTNTQQLQGQGHLSQQSSGNSTRHFSHSVYFPNFNTPTLSNRFFKC